MPAIYATTKQIKNDLRTLICLTVIDLHKIFAQQYPAYTSIDTSTKLIGVYLHKDCWNNQQLLKISPGDGTLKYFENFTTKGRYFSLWLNLKFLSYRFFLLVRRISVYGQEQTKINYLKF